MYVYTHVRREKYEEGREKLRRRMTTLSCPRIQIRKSADVSQNVCILKSQLCNFDSTVVSVVSGEIEPHRSKLNCP